MITNDGHTYSYYATLTDAEREDMWADARAWVKKNYPNVEVGSDRYKRLVRDRVEVLRKNRRTAKTNQAIDAAEDELFASQPWMQDTGLYGLYIEEYLKTGDTAQAWQAVRGSDQYLTYFPGNMLEDGRVRYDENAYLAYRDAYVNAMSKHGLPAGMYDSIEDVGKLIEGEVSIDEVIHRIEEGFVAAQYAPQEVRDAMNQYFGVHGEAMLASYFLDPDRTLKTIQHEWTQAQIGGASLITGFGNLTADRAKELADLGVDFGQALDTFGQLSYSEELFTDNLGLEGGAISEDEQIEAFFKNDGAARQKVEKRREERLAEFEGGGGAAFGQRGIAGLGSSDD